ncbi:hypothetical protein [Methanolobus vulcani]|uniref:Uncharacterized protein n=1 Tax=Methanolobus vulcani TaxID=38026 RepID=A0A7Z8KMZ9_9EURY|nr:hypothetical protein [Methanolobus vulcani]TQD25116.1 hypothetical protein FKV42_08675 [Methanolobus vulcani]
MAGTFYSGAKVLADLIDEIADKLIAEGWTDGDTTWDTTDRTVGANNARRCLYHSTDDIYLTLECHDQPYWVYSTSYQAKGLRIAFHSTWDSVNHTYPNMDYHTYIPFFGRSSTTPVTNCFSTQLTYYCWVDSTGFVLMARPEANSTDNLQVSAITVVERIASKEYSDGLTNFYNYTKLNYEGWRNTAGNSLGRCHNMCRPFTYTNSWSTEGIQFWHADYHAFKSDGNGKVYYAKPLIFNDQAETMPIGQSELFFMFSEGGGLVDGDVVAIDGATTKFLCIGMDSPDNTGRVNYAIKYVE